MRIMIDGSTLCDPHGGTGGGIEHYSWAITSALLKIKSPHSFFIYLPHEFQMSRLSSLNENVLKRAEWIRPITPKISFLSRHIFSPLHYVISRSDVVFSPGGQLPLFWKGKSIATIHDVMIYEHPKWFAPLGNQNFSTRVVVPKTISHATRLIAVSETIKRRLSQIFPGSEEKTTVVYEGVEPPQLSEDELVSTYPPFDRDYVLFLGTIEPRKNLNFAFDVFNLFLQSHPEMISSVRFLVAGKFGWGTESILEHAKKINSYWQEYEPDGVIKFLGEVTEEEKWILLARANVFMFPSFDEGFGLPILEAMSVGTTVLSSGRGALSEVGGDAVISIDINNIGSASLALAQCLMVPEGIKDLKMEGWKRAKNFSWSRAAEETLAVIESALNKKN